MAVLIDPPRWPAHERLWSHLVSDTSLDELHAFAERIGLPRRGFDADHYDVPQERHAQALAAGAQPVEGRELVRRLLASGLRRPKRHGERLLTSSAVTATGERIDALAGGRPVHPAPTEVVILLWYQGFMLGVRPEHPGDRLHPPRVAIPSPASALTGRASALTGPDDDLRVARRTVIDWLLPRVLGVQEPTGRALSSTALDSLRRGGDEWEETERGGDELGVTRMGQLRSVWADTGRPIGTASVVRVVSPWRGTPRPPAHWCRVGELSHRLDPLIEVFVTDGTAKGASGA